MILDSLNAANNAILTSVQLSKNKQAVQSYTKQLSSLSNQTTQLDHLLNMIEAISEKGISTNIISSETAATVANAIEDCGQKTYDHSLDVSTVTSLKNAIAILRNELDTFWRQLAKNECTPIIEAIVSLIGLLDNKKEANELLEYFEKVTQNTPIFPASLDIYLRNVDRGKKIIENLHFSSDPEIRVFIKKVRTSHATVKDLTPHIIDWLNSNNLATKIKLRF